MIEVAALILSGIAIGLSGIAIGLTIATIRNQRADRELFEILKPRIANTAAPTTSELTPTTPWRYVVTPLIRRAELARSAGQPVHFTRAEFDRYKEGMDWEDDPINPVFLGVPVVIDE